MAPTPKQDPALRLDKDEIDEYLYRLARIFGNDVLHHDQILALFFLHAVETLGTKKAAAQAMGLDMSTGWRLCRKVGAAHFIEERERD